MFRWKIDQMQSFLTEVNFVGECKNMEIYILHLP